jgi:hypothetical protein
MNSMESLEFNGRLVRRIDCAFVNPMAAMLTIVQRYVSNLEHEQQAYQLT